MKGVERITVSLQEKTYQQLEKIIEKENWSNRSQVINHLINMAANEIQAKQNNIVVAGSLTLFYQESKREIHKKVVKLQRENIEQIISSNRILLENGCVMEILVLQGYTNKLMQIKKDFITIKGVDVGRIALTRTKLPPIES